MKRKAITGEVLLLGMVFAHQANEPKRGQEFRDRVRCEAVKNLGYTVYTLDDKHEDREIAEHCRANFADTRRMLASIHAKWDKTLKFDEIILDYFFSPNGWARCRWSEKFFSQTLPAFATQGLLKENGRIWLPNLPVIEEQLIEAMSILTGFYRIEITSDCHQNPLYRATESVESELLLCPDKLTNETQLRPLLQFSSRPFYCLSLKADWQQSPPATPSKSRKSSRKISEILEPDSTSSSPKKRKRN